MKSIYDVLKGTGIVESSLGNWKFLLFLFALLFGMIGANHMVDQKVRYLTRLNKELKELKMIMVDYKAQYVKKTRFSSVVSKLEKKGFVFSDVPPELIIVDDQQGTE